MACQDPCKGVPTIHKGSYIIIIVLYILLAIILGSLIIC